MSNSPARKNINTTTAEAVINAEVLARPVLAATGANVLFVGIALCLLLSKMSHKNPVREGGEEDLSLIHI